MNSAEDCPDNVNNCEQVAALPTAPGPPGPGYPISAHSIPAPITPITFQRTSSDILGLCVLFMLIQEPVKLDDANFVELRLYVA